VRERETKETYGDTMFWNYTPESILYCLKAIISKITVGDANPVIYMI
jgi:hypothetical protein